MERPALPRIAVSTAMYRYTPPTRTMRDLVIPTRQRRSDLLYCLKFHAPHFDGRVDPFNAGRFSAENSASFVERAITLNQFQYLGVSSSSHVLSLPLSSIKRLG